MDVNVVGFIKIKKLLRYVKNPMPSNFAVRHHRYLLNAVFSVVDVVVVIVVGVVVIGVGVVGVIVVGVGVGVVVAVVVGVQLLAVSFSVF